MKCSDFSAKIPAYLEGRLPEEESEAFEMHFFECHLCFAQLKIEERLFSKEISIPLKSTVPKKNLKSFLRWNWPPLTAVTSFASILLVVFLSVIYITGSINKSKRLDEYYRLSEFTAPAYLTSETRKESSTSNPAGSNRFAEAMELYSAGNYSRALVVFKSIGGSGKNPQVIFFKGVCHLLEDELKAAVLEFDVIIESMNPSYYDEAIYYKAIALLRLDKREPALQNLQNLSGMFSPYASKAKKLIQEITNL